MFNFFLKQSWLLAYDRFFVKMIAMGNFPRCYALERRLPRSKIKRKVLGQKTSLSPLEQKVLFKFFKLYELSSGALITTIFMEVALTAVTMDTLECLVFIRDMKGSLHRINLFERSFKIIRHVQLKSGLLKKSLIPYLDDTSKAKKVLVQKPCPLEQKGLFNCCKAGQVSCFKAGRVTCFKAGTIRGMSRLSDAILKLERCHSKTWTVALLRCVVRSS